MEYGIKRKAVRRRRNSNPYLSLAEPLGNLLGVCRRGAQSEYFVLTGIDLHNYTVSTMRG